MPVRIGIHWPGQAATVFVAAALLLSCFPKEGQRVALDDFQLQTLNGQALDMRRYQGKRVFINVWATWCRPCVQEMPTIAAAMRQLEGSDVAFLFASPEEAEEITRFREQKNFPFEYVRLLNLEALGIQALPSTYIFDANGALVYREEGFRDWSTPQNLAHIKPAAE